MTHLTIDGVSAGGRASVHAIPRNAGGGGGERSVGGSEEAREGEERERAEGGGLGGEEVAVGRGRAERGRHSPRV